MGFDCPSLQCNTKGNIDGGHSWVRDKSTVLTHAAVYETSLRAIAVSLSVQNFFL
ncbi:hypothetical protein E2C01_045170 [Portunus trituberculatus]|uniref:Uncharacterized protein n=1 Tax=Portunus trituberculatus TaxID=210409 RepID=A0A5B7G0J3_PORTR|nr:hypothetical protein [Portunus trituberculatus]